jgi:hypothetical protein
MLCVRVTIWVPQRWSSPESAHHQQSINHSIVQRTEVQENVACGLVFEQSITRLGAREHLGISTVTAPWTDSSGRSGSQTGYSQGWRGKSFCYCPFGIASVGPREGWTWRLSVVGLAAWKSEKIKQTIRNPKCKLDRASFPSGQVKLTDVPNRSLHGPFIARIGEMVVSGVSHALDVLQAKTLDWIVYCMSDNGSQSRLPCFGGGRLGCFGTGCVCGREVLISREEY